jgi:methionyl-tRNA formyltransferase
MNVVFFGTPEFAVPTLKALASAGHDISAVVTTPDKPQGRGRRLQPSVVKQAAIEADYRVLQPESLRDPDFIRELVLLAADLFVVVAFRILPREVFAIPPMGTINLHASLLPKYRGAAPINWAIINGESATGATTFYIREKVDTGGILMQERVDIAPDMTAGELSELLAGVGSGLAVRTVQGIADGSLKPGEQDDSLATPAPKLFREMCAVDWSLSSSRVHDFIRGLSPHPAAWTKQGGAVLKVLRSGLCTDRPSPGPGIVIRERNSLFVGCCDGCIEIRELQPEGRRAMSASEFLRGYRIGSGDALG